MTSSPRSAARRASPPATSPTATPLEALLATVPDLTGVVHAAGVLDDATIESLTPEQVHTVLQGQGRRRPAPARAHRPDLDTFVLFSSAAATSSAAPARATTPPPTPTSTRSPTNAAPTACPAHVPRLGPVGAAAWPAAWTKARTQRLARLGPDARSPTSTASRCTTRRSPRRRRAWCTAALDMGALQAQARLGALPALLQGLVRVPKRRRRDGGSLAQKLANAPRGAVDGRHRSARARARRRRARPPAAGDRPRAHLQGPGLRLADRRRAAQRALAPDRRHPPRHARLRPPDARRRRRAPARATLDQRHKPPPRPSATRAATSRSRSSA